MPALCQAISITGTLPPSTSDTSNGRNCREPTSYVRPIPELSRQDRGWLHFELACIKKEAAVGSAASATGE